MPMNLHNYLHEFRKARGTLSAEELHECELLEGKRHNLTQDESYKVAKRINPETGELEIEKPDRLASSLRFCARMRRERTKFIYVIQAGEFVKIGVATDVAKRIQELQTGCPYNLKLVVAVPCKNAYASERSVHDRLQAFHTRGEWFRASRSEIDAALSELRKCP
jgi:hypothetical protein